jgi:hypothetical protein
MGPKIFQKSRNDLKSLGIIKVICSKFHVEDPQILRATIQNLVAQVTWHWTLVHHWDSKGDAV